MKKKVKKDIIVPFEFEYDPQSQEFKNSFQNFKEMFLYDDTSYMSEDDKLDSFFLHIADSVLMAGPQCMIEGVGYVSVEGRILHKDEWCGVDICYGDPENMYIQDSEY